MLRETKRENVGDNIERAVNAIEQQEASLASTVKDWAAWDDTYEFVKNRNERYLESNIYEDVSEFIPVPPDLKKALDQGGSLYNTDSNFAVSGIIKLPVDRIKIAMSFVHGISVSEEDDAITKAIIVLAKKSWAQYSSRRSQSGAAPYIPESADVRRNTGILLLQAYAA